MVAALAVGEEDGGAGAVDFVVELDAVDRREWHIGLKFTPTARGGIRGSALRQDGLVVHRQVRRGPRARRC